MEEVVLTGNLKGVALKEKEVSRRIDALGLEEGTSMALKEKLLPFVIEAEKWKAQADAIVILKEGDKDNMKLAREARLALKGIRVNLEKERKALKKESLAKGQAIDLIAGTLRTLIEPIEDDLDLKERYDEIKLAERKQKLWELRAQELAIYKLEQYPFDLREATEEDYNKFKDGLEVARLAQIAKDEELEKLRLEEENRKKEIARKKELAAARSKEMLQKGFQHEGVDLGELDDFGYQMLLEEKQKEKDEKELIQKLKSIAEQSIQAISMSINRATLDNIDQINGVIDIFEKDPERKEALADFYSEKAKYVRGLLEEKKSGLLAMQEVNRVRALNEEMNSMFAEETATIDQATLETITSPEKLEVIPDKYVELNAHYKAKYTNLLGRYKEKLRQLQEVARLEKEKSQLVVENVQLQAQAPEIVVEKKVEPAPAPAPKKNIFSRKNEEAEAKAAPAPVVPAGPTPEDISSDKVTLVALAGIIASIQMPEVKTAQANVVLVDTARLIEKIRVYIIEKAKTIK